MLCHQLPFAGIASFRAPCPQSPGRGSSPRATQRPAWLEDVGSLFGQTCEGVQGISVSQAPTWSPRVLVTSEPSRPATSLLPPALSNDRGAQASRQRSKGSPELFDTLLANSMSCSSWRPNTVNSATTAPDSSASNIRLLGRQVLLPSCGADNDAVRVQCSGRKLGAWNLMAIKPRALESQTVDVGHSFRQTASTPSLPSAPGRIMHDRPMHASNSMSTLDFGRHTIGTGSAWAEKMKSPGHHKYSSIPMEYPGLDPTLRPATSFCPHIFYPKPKTPQLVPGARKKALPSGRNAADIARSAAEKSVRMRDALFNLRRAGKPEKSETPSHSPEPLTKLQKKHKKSGKGSKSSRGRATDLRVLLYMGATRYYEFSTEG